jgi:hypothetical protein
VPDDEHEQREPEAEQQKPEEATAAHGTAQGGAAAAARASSRASRCGSSAIMRVRALSVSAAHCVISSSVRPHPRHNCDDGSTVQILLQGVCTGMAFPANIEAAA